MFAKKFQRFLTPSCGRDNKYLREYFEFGIWMNELTMQLILKDKKQISHPQQSHWDQEYLIPFSHSRVLRMFS